MVLENNEPYQMYVQVNAFDPWVCGAEPMGVPCPHEWATVRLRDELSQPKDNLVSLLLLNMNVKNSKEKQNDTKDIH